MIYSKALASVILFDNSDIITQSNCPGNAANKGNGQGGGNDCLNNDNNKQYCSHGVNSKVDGPTAAGLDPMFW